MTDRLERMEQQTGCPHADCAAARMIEAIKQSNTDYRKDIKEELVDIKKGIKDLVKSIGEYTTRVAVLEQAIMFLREAESENKAAHIKIFQRLEATESRTTTWLWELLKLLIVAGLGFGGGMLAKM